MTRETREGNGPDKHSPSPARVSLLSEKSSSVEYLKLSTEKVKSIHPRID